MFVKFSFKSCFLFERCRGMGRTARRAGDRVPADLLDSRRRTAALPPRQRNARRTRRQSKRLRDHSAAILTHTQGIMWRLWPYSPLKKRGIWPHRRGSVECGKQIPRCVNSVIHYMTILSRIRIFKTCLN